MLPHTKCDCPKGQEVCLFCWYPEMKGYIFEKYSAPSVCPRCCGQENGVFSVHTLCVATLKLYCPISSNDSKIGFDSLCGRVILARPLVRPEREGFLSEHLLKRFTLPSLPNLNTLPPETIKDICFYLDPYPELVAITYALSVAIRYKTHRTHSWTDLDLKPGMTLYMTFSNFERCTYLTNIDNKPSAKYDKMLQVQDEFQVCRDHFAIQDIHGTGDRLYGHNVRGESVFYQTINLRKIGRKELKIRGFSDGRFLRAFLPLDGSPRLVEWNIPPSSIQGETYWFSKSRRTLPTFNRCEYHDLNDISGISAAVQGSKTIGLFCHRQEPKTRFGSFIRRLERTYPGMKLIYLFFPISKQEKIQAIAVRRIPDLLFPTNTPVIQIATNYGRTYSFGPQPQQEHHFEYECLRPITNGVVQGLFYFSPGDDIPALSDIGVSASGLYERVQNLNISPGESLPCPSIGSPNQSWCFSRARLELNTKAQLCKSSAADRTCLGILLTYSDGGREALGEIRFDKHLSESVNVQDYGFSNQEIDGKLYVSARVWSDCENCSTWHRFPTKGKVVWWCGWNGNQIEVLD